MALFARLAGFGGLISRGRGLGVRPRPAGVGWVAVRLSGDLVRDRLGVAGTGVAWASSGLCVGGSLWVGWCWEGSGCVGEMRRACGVVVPCPPCAPPCCRGHVRQELFERL